MKLPATSSNEAQSIKQSTRKFNNYGHVVCFTLLDLLGIDLSPSGRSQGARSRVVTVNICTSQYVFFLLKIIVYLWKDLAIKTDRISNNILNPQMGVRGLC